MNDLMLVGLIAAGGFALVTLMGKLKPSPAVAVPPPTSTPPVPGESPMLPAVRQMAEIARKLREHEEADRLHNLMIGRMTPISSTLPPEIVPHPSAQVKKPDATPPNV